MEDDELDTLVYQLLCTLGEQVVVSEGARRLRADHEIER